MASLAKRFKFNRSTTSDALNTAESASNSGSGSGSGEVEKEKQQGLTTSIEADPEAQRKVSVAHELAKKYNWDPNLPRETLEDLDAATEHEDIRTELNLVDAFEENSPYPEVRAAVRNVRFFPCRTADCPLTG